MCQGNEVALVREQQTSKRETMPKDTPNTQTKAQEQESPAMKIFFRLYAMVISWILSGYTLYNLDRFRATANEKGIQVGFHYKCGSITLLQT